MCVDVSNINLKHKQGYPGFKRIFFFLSILTVRGEAASTRREAPRRALSNHKHVLFHLRYFENGPVEPG